MRSAFPFASLGEKLPLQQALRLGADVTPLLYRDLDQGFESWPGQFNLKSHAALPLSR